VTPFPPEVLGELLKDCKTPEQMFGSDRLLPQLAKAVVEASPKAGLTARPAAQAITLSTHSILFVNTPTL
jgi:hypothetical protein